MENLNTSGKMLPLFKSRPLHDPVKIRNVRASDLETVSTLLLNGVSLHGGSFWSGAETRRDWLARIHGDGEKHVCEEIRVATLGIRIVGAYALVGSPLPVEETWASLAASLRFFTLNAEFYSESLVNLLLKDAAEICSRWKLSRISAEVFSGVHPLIPILEKIGFHRVFGERAEDALLCFGSRSYLLDINPGNEQGVLAQ